MNIINPATDEIIATINADHKDSISTAYHTVKEGQQRWARQCIDDRLTTISSFKELLLSNIDDLAQTLSSEVGKPISQAVGEIKGACGRIDFFLNNAKEILQEEERYTATGLTEKVSYEPLGVIANISAWNYPYLVGVNVFIPALIAGNAVLYKPSEYSTLTGLAIERLLHQAGIPQNVFVCIKGTGEVGAMLLDLPLDAYFFTGSYKTGQLIYTKVAPKMVPCQMELGGKDPLYVSHHNSDIKGIAAATADGAFYNNGQSCCAVERIYVHEAVYETYAEAFIEEVKAYKIGEPSAADTYIGPLTRKDQMNVLKHQVKDAISKGATLAAGGNPIDRIGNYFEPTILIDVDHSMEVMKEESFGPIIGIQKVANNDEAIALMNDTPYGLTSAIYTDNDDEFIKMANAMKSGTVYRNCCDRVSAHLPWSGRKNSGFGSTLGKEGVLAFVQVKAWHLK